MNHGIDSAQSYEQRIAEMLDGRQVGEVNGGTFRSAASRLHSLRESGSQVRIAVNHHDVPVGRLISDGGQRHATAADPGPEHQHDVGVAVRVAHRVAPVMPRVDSMVSARLLRKAS